MEKLLFSDKINIDAQRSTDAERCLAHLYSEGKFYRAFNYSAWLISQYIYNEEYRKSINASSPINVSRSKSKEGAEYIVCGFPIHSLKKYCGGLEFEVIDSNHTVVKMPQDALGMNEQEFRGAYNDYAATISFKPKKSEEQKQFGTVDAEGQPRSLGMIDIFRKIISYRLIEHTPTEAVGFLQEVQQDLLRLM